MTLRRYVVVVHLGNRKRRWKIIFYIRANFLRFPSCFCIKNHWKPISAFLWSKHGRSQRFTLETGVPRDKIVFFDSITSNVHFCIRNQPSALTEPKKHPKHSTFNLTSQRTPVRDQEFTTTLPGYLVLLLSELLATNSQACFESYLWISAAKSLMWRCFPKLSSCYKFLLRQAGEASTRKAFCLVCVLASAQSRTNVRLHWIIC